MTLSPNAKSSPFDREKSSLHYLTVEARDDLGKGNRNNVEIVVHIIDVNDNAPRFGLNFNEIKHNLVSQRFEGA